MSCELNVCWVFCVKHLRLGHQPCPTGNVCVVVPMSPPWQDEWHRMCQDDLGLVGVEPLALSAPPPSILMPVSPPCVTGGAAMRAGVQEGDRIVKVSILFRRPCYFSNTGPRAPLPPPACLTPSLLSQVNGTMVTNSSHLEVVKLIKCEYGQGAMAAPSHPK